MCHLMKAGEWADEDGKKNTWARNEETIHPGMGETLLKKVF